MMKITVGVMTAQGSHGAPRPQLGVVAEVVGDGRLGDPPHPEILHQAAQVVGVGVSVLAPAGGGLHVDVVPGDRVLHPGRHAPVTKTFISPRKTDDILYDMTLHCLRNASKEHKEKYFHIF